MADIVIRLATAADAVHFPDIEKSAGQAFLAIAGLEWLAGGDVMAADQHQKYIDQSTVWVAMLDGHRIGFVTAAACDDALHILELSVANGHQGKGVGRQLMDAARQYAGEAGFPALSLTTFRDLAFNEQFYRKLGYQTLEGAGISERLAAILRSERENGLPGDRRCAMTLLL